MVDPLISLAFAVHTNPGGYCLLLGSGVSRAAGIPTGWEIVLDLTTRLASLEGGDAAGDPAGWYRQRYGHEPDYSELLRALAPTPAERQRLLQGYFEPTEQERAEGVKVPTDAHKAIARLVAGGHVGVIVTTNFDRLLETALAELGVVPTLIATPDAARGAPPLARSRCTIVKPHGDYLDARIRNTPDELAKYDRTIGSLLHRIFDEHGIVVCGWSADWDQALRDALSRSAARRFSTFWCTRRTPSGLAGDLIQQRQAQVIQIADADSFFVELDEKVQALDDLERPHPLSTAAAVAALKRYLPNEENRIRLHDLVSEEVTRVESATGDESFPVSGDLPTFEIVVARLERYEAVCETLLPMMAVGCYWGTSSQRILWVHVLDQLANRWTSRSGLESWLKLCQYPTALALYAGGLGAVAKGNLATLAALFADIEVSDMSGDQEPLVLVAHPNRVVNDDTLRVPSQLRTPLSDRLRTVFREPLRELLPQDARYDEVFDEFEYLQSLAFADRNEKRVQSVWAPVGGFAWRQRRRREGNLYARIEEKANTAEETWGFLQGKLFDGSLDRFLEIKKAYDARVAGLGWSW